MEADSTPAAVSSARLIADGRPCSICGQYEVGAENAWLCYRCGFNGPQVTDAATAPENHA